MDDKVKVLGISASHRKGWNTEYAVAKALKAAEDLGPWVQTELIRLADLEIHPCSGCHLCFSQAEEGSWCPVWKDGMNELYPRLLAADGLIVGTPVYWWSASGKLKDFIDRTNPFCSSANTRFSGALMGKAAGALAVAYDVHGGTEIAVSHIQAWMLAIGLIVVGTHGPHMGGTAATNLGTPSAAPDSVKNDPHGMKTIYELGRRVAETALHLREGRSQAAVRVDERPAPAEEGRLIDWEKFFSFANSFPREQIGVPKVLATSRRAFEAFIELMAARKKRSGQTWSPIRDVEAFRRTWLEGHGLRLLSDEQLYDLCPEFYGRFLK
jgi:multimeric flavodoxin WrbA